MRLTKKLNITLVFVVVCLIMLVWASYAWFTISKNPEVHQIATNVGANGSLEVALLSEETFLDPSKISAAVGDSAVKQGVRASNESWGNLIDLSSSGYGLQEISLMPSRLNLVRDKNGNYRVANSMLKTAEFGTDGRIRFLGDETVSTVWEEYGYKGYFTYYVKKQRYGVRGIGTISNLSAQQIDLAKARSLVAAYQSAAVRKAEESWQQYGGGVVDILYRHYDLKENTLTPEGVVALQQFALGMQEAAKYVGEAMVQTYIGMAAMHMVEESDFEAFRDEIQRVFRERGTIDSYDIRDYWVWMDKEQREALFDISREVERLLEDAQYAVNGSLALATKHTWKQVEYVFDFLMPLKSVYVDEEPVAAGVFSTSHNFHDIMVSDGVYNKIADFTGNFDAFSGWQHTEWDHTSVLAYTASTKKEPVLSQMQVALESGKAAVGGWTRANMDSLYAYAVDLAFRSNEASKLQLQTENAKRIEGLENTENFSVQGGGSYMSFLTKSMDAEHLITLMDTLRVAFLDNRGMLLGVAKLFDYIIEDPEYCQSNGYENGAYGRLYLCDYQIDEAGKLVVGFKKYNSKITDLVQNSPKIVTVVVWMDGDCVDNSMAGADDFQSMTGYCNLQFSSDADLIPAEQRMK